MSLGIGLISYWHYNKGNEGTNAAIKAEDTLRSLLPTALRPDNSNLKPFIKS